MVSKSPCACPISSSTQSATNSRAFRSVRTSLLSHKRTIAMLDVEAFKKIVESAAFHRLIGLKLESADAEAGVVVLRQAYDPKLSIFPDAGVYHGGVIASPIDVSRAVACGLPP